MSVTYKPLVPKHTDGRLRALVIGRISTPHQNEESIDASYRFVEGHLARLFSGAIVFKHLGERASGMLSGRKTIREAEDLIATREWDLVVAEDLSRIFRNPRHQYNFVQDAVDAETRVICIADNLDTADENWELMLSTAALRHGLVVSDTRRRVRRTAIHSFHSGGMVQKVRYGYRRLSKDEAKSGNFGPVGLAIAKRPECTPVILEMKNRFMRGDSYVAIADWANKEHVETPPYSQNEYWTGRLIKDLLADPILSGFRTFRKTICEPIYKTGHYKRRTNSEPELELYPELAHMGKDEHRELVATMDERTRERKPRRSGSEHPLWSKPRTRTIWPAQHARCAICGSLMYRYDRDQLKCANSSKSNKDRCWNHVQVKCEIVRLRIIRWLLGHLYEQQLINKLVAAAKHEQSRLLARRSQANNATRKEVSKLEAEARNITKAIALGGSLNPLVQRLKEIETRIEEVKVVQQAETDRANTQPSDVEALVTQNLELLVLSVARESHEFSELMRTLISSFTIQPVQALDSGLVRPRGFVTLQNDTTLPKECPLTFDFFDPPTHIQNLAECVSLKKMNPHLSYKKIASALNINHMTVKRAIHYQRLMDQGMQTDPYRVLTTRPRNASRWSVL